MGLKLWLSYRLLSDQIGRSVMSDSLRPHESQHTRPPCPSPTPRAHSDSCPSSQWCHPTISSSVVPFSSCLLLLLLLPLHMIMCNIRVFSNESVLHIRWPKYCSFSFSISPSNECIVPMTVMLLFNKRTVTIAARHYKVISESKTMNIFLKNPCEQC